MSIVPSWSHWWALWIPKDNMTSFILPDRSQGSTISWCTWSCQHAPKVWAIKQLLMICHGWSQNENYVCTCPPTTAPSDATSKWLQAIETILAIIARTKVCWFTWPTLRVWRMCISTCCRLKCWQMKSLMQQYTWWVEISGYISVSPWIVCSITELRRWTYRLDAKWGQGHTHVACVAHDSSSTHTVADTCVWTSAQSASLPVCQHKQRGWYFWNCCRRTTMTLTLPLHLLVSAH